MLILNVLVYCWSLCTVLHLQPHAKQLSEQFACLYLKGKSSGLFFFFFFSPWQEYLEILNNLNIN